MLLRLIQIWLTVIRYGLSSHPRPVKIRLILQSLGGAFVKLGQILALRADIVSEALARELLNLLDQLSPVSGHTVQQILRQELRGEVKDLFQKFDFLPLASASLAQVHRATMWTGEEVVVKVQRPEIAGILQTDFQILVWAGRVLDLLGSPLPIPAKRVVKEFIDWTGKELDFRKEAENAERLQQIQTKLEGVIIPKIFSQYTTRRVLVEEFIPGQTLKAILVTDAFSSFDPARLAALLIESTMQQYFLLGSFHADPHAGNLIAKGNGMLGYVDFGIIGRASLEHRVAMANFVRHTVQKNYPAAITAFLHLGLVKRLTSDLPYLLVEEGFMNLFTQGLGVFKTVVIKKFAKIVNRWHEAVADKEAGFGEKSAAGTFLRFLRMVSRLRLRLEPDILLFIKTLIAVDAICLKLNPAFNLPHTIKQVFTKPSYSFLFAPQSLATLNQPLEQLTICSNNQEKTDKLKEYYWDWLSAIITWDESAFRKALHAGKEKEVTYPSPSPRDGGLPSWIVEMQKSMRRSS